MTGKTHRMAGMAAGLTVYFAAAEPSYAPATFFAVIAATYLASLLPDIDQPASDIWHSIPLGHQVGKLVDPVLKHRNLSHSILGITMAGLLAYLLLLMFPSYWGIDTHLLLIIFLVAYGSHLLLDMVTIEGVPLLYPYKRFFGIPPYPFDGARIETGKWFENLVLFPIINIAIVVLLLSKWYTIKLILLK